MKPGQGNTGLRGGWWVRSHTHTHTCSAGGGDEHTVNTLLHTSPHAQVCKFLVPLYYGARHQVQRVPEAAFRRGVWSLASQGLACPIFLEILDESGAGIKPTVASRPGAGVKQPAASRPGGPKPVGHAAQVVHVTAAAAPDN